jgi:hypothetical protein
MNSSRSQLFDQTCMSLCLQSAFTASCARPRLNAWGSSALQFLEALCHALKSHFAVRILRPPLGGRYRNSTRAMNQAHSGLNLVTMLPTRPTGNKEIYFAIAFQRSAICWILFRRNHLLLKTTLPWSRKRRYLISLSEPPLVVGGTLLDVYAHHDSTVTPSQS